MGITSFLMGAIIASTMPGHSPLPKNLNQIPIRCMAALEDGDLEYSKCRWATLTEEWEMTSTSECKGHTAWTYSECKKEAINRALHWEIRALRSLADKHD